MADEKTTLADEEVRKLLLTPGPLPPLEGDTVERYRDRLKCQAETRDPDVYDQFNPENN